MSEKSNLPNAAHLKSTSGDGNSLATADTHRRDSHTLPMLDLIMVYSKKEIGEDDLE